MQKPIPSAQMQFTHAIQSPELAKNARRVVCGSQVDVAAGISTRDSAVVEKLFLKLVFEGLCGAAVTLVKRFDYRTPHSWYTLASQSQS